jgi:hypothetical protein
VGRTNSIRELNGRPIRPTVGAGAGHRRKDRWGTRPEWPHTCPTALPAADAGRARKRPSWYALGTLIDLPSLGRRTIVHAGVTAHPSARCAAHRIAEATSDAHQVPRFLLHDRDSIYGLDFPTRVQGLGTRLLATPPRALAANPFAGRAVGTSAGTASTT